MAVVKIQSKHGSVEIVEQTLAARFVVLGSSGYRAELPVCLNDLCANGTRVPCAIPLTTHYGHQHSVKVDGKVANSVDAWLRHTQTHCHDWHWPTVERFAREVLATYGARPALASGKSGVARGNLSLPFVGVGYVHRDVANMTRIVAQNKHSAEEWAAWHKVVAA